MVETTHSAAYTGALLVLLSIALLLAAAAVMLWHWSGKARARKSARQLLERRIGDVQQEPIEPVLTSEAWRPAPSAAQGEESAESLARRLGAMPWGDEQPVFSGEGNRTGKATSKSAANSSARTGADGKAAPASPALEFTMPAWLLGVIMPRSLLMSAAGIVLLSGLAGIVSGPLAAAGAFGLLLIIFAFVIWLRVQRYRRKLVHQLPAFLDAMVRLITVGNSTQASFQMAIATTREPLRGYLDRAASLVRAGMDLDRALHQTATQVRIEEMFLLASILGLGVRYGGRADLLLERVANFMRDREQAEHELVAMSSETRLSAWVLGVLPIAVTAFIITVNPGYFMRMWQDDSGRYLVFGAIGLQMLGAGLLYRLTKLS